ncbi:hypothetical protein [Pseudoalteromonas sp. S16_S37]|uniref:hypothetical protein n=1 Tax=Pseudoalteromonas sp. S16_S37 TaxID=2720228 RepID=UPI0016811384|nr:hypothetical protein [Pseudoalteromonas sp. S16_S37]MBD1583504.1 hypothetical protein [Pseudoalteromonas sp. S16_S37]
MINLSSKLKKALESGHSYAHLLHIDFPSSGLRFTDAGYDVQAHGATYKSGVWSKAPDIEVMGEPKIGEITIKLHANNSDISAIFFNSNWLNLPVSIYRIYFDNDMTLVGDVKIWDGLLSGKSGRESQKEASLDLKAASIWADFEAASGRKTNDESQKLHFPDDNGFEFCGVLIKDIPWGKKGATPAPLGGVGRGGGNQQHN